MKVLGGIIAVMSMVGMILKGKVEKGVKYELREDGVITKDTLGTVKGIKVEKKENNVDSGRKEYIFDDYIVSQNGDEKLLKLVKRDDGTESIKEINLSKVTTYGYSKEVLRGTVKKVGLYEDKVVIFSNKDIYTKFKEEYLGSN